MFYRFSLIVLGYALFATSLFAGDLSPELQKNADYTLQGFDDTIMRINSGICRINGQSKVGSKTSDDEFEIAFDFANNYYRFDRKGQCHSLRTPEYYYEFW
ncbi:MAG: hypothetical protein LBU65_06685, partial [Planctomycetaceae bacterium]|nr:hypothetical protein [Planctomycetaceae bacterium]